MLSHCTLCPRRCGVDRTRGELGFCGEDSRCRIARAALHFWEEPCISGEKGSGTVFFSGCNMKCIYCQNHEISRNGKGRFVTEEELAEQFLELEALGANNINLVTPTHFVPQIKSALLIAKEKGLSVPIVYNCGGYESVSTLSLLSGLIDIYIPDMKYFSDKYAVEYSSAPNYFKAFYDALSEMLSQTGSARFDSRGIMQRGVIVRHMMLPGHLSDTRQVLDFLAEGFGDDIYISLMSQYTPMPQVENHKKLCRRLSMRQYEAMVSYCLSLGLKNVYIQEDGASSESFIPKFYGEEYKTPERKDRK